MKASFKIINPKIIEQKLNQIKTLKKNLSKMTEDFYIECFNFFVEKANAYLEYEDIGDMVKWRIQRSWAYKKTEYGFRIYNEDSKAVFVEVGVGEVGENNPHPTSNQYGNNYEYNVPSMHKRASELHPNPNTWRFYVISEDDIDLKEGDYEAYELLDASKIKVITTGSQGSMYAYNAFIELKNNYKKLWEKVKARYI